VLAQTFFAYMNVCVGRALASHMTQWPAQMFNDTTLDHIKASLVWAYLHSSSS